MVLSDVFKLPFRIYRKVKRIVFSKNKNDKNGNLPISYQEYNRIKSLARYQYDETILFGKKFRIADAISFLSSLQEIFVGEIYKFIPGSGPITIIDCGANIGLASIYFKMKFPEARVMAFEAD